jgi:hypothetical protein
MGVLRICVNKCSVSVSDSRGKKIKNWDRHILFVVGAIDSMCAQAATEEKGQVSFSWAV